MVMPNVRSSAALSLIVMILLVACGGGASSDDNVLQFTGRDETEANFRGRVRDILLTPPGQSICTGLRGLSPEEAAEVLRSDDDDDDASQFAGATAKPGQSADPKDLRRAAEIVLQECGRLTS